MPGLTALFRDNANLIRRRRQIGLAAKPADSIRGYTASADGRYILTPSGQPWLLIGDSPQGLIVCLSTADAATYMAHRAAHGFNCIQAHLIAGTTFGGRSDRTTYDSIAPFTTPEDISTPNPAYFDRVAEMVRIAGIYGLVVMLTVSEHIDSASLFVDNTACRAFGRYVGERLGRYKNLIWSIGNDFQDWATNATKRDANKALLDGLRDVTPHLRTAWLDYYVSRSRETRSTQTFDSYVELDFCYTYYPCYDVVLDSRAMGTAKPAFMGEANYEGEALQGYDTTPFVVRKQTYWTLLAGAAGVFYCNEDIYAFITGWASRLDSWPGYEHTKLAADLLRSYDWWTLTPDSAHGVLTAGYGTYADGSSGSIDSNDYAPCSWISDGSLALVYMPTNRTMTVDMSKFSGTVTCRWFDPTDGSYTADAASPHANSGTHDFSRATTNSTGGSDWVLVLEV